MNKPRLALVGGYFPRSPGGAEIQTYYISKALRIKYEVHFIYIDSHVSKIRREKENEFILWALPKRKLLRRVFNKVLILDYFKIKRILGIIKPVIVYQRSGTAYTGICAHLKGFGSYRFVWHIASDSDVNKIRNLNILSPFRLIDRIACLYGMRKADVIIAQTKYQAEQILNNYRIKATAVITNFGEPPSTIIHKSTETIKISWINNIKENKRPEIYLKLAKEFESHANIRFVMAGNKGNARIQKDLDDIIMKSSNVEYLGLLSQEEVMTLLQESHLLVNTSIVEGFSNVFIQAWFCHCPVLSYTVNPDNVLTDSSVGYCAEGEFNRMISFVKKFVSDSNLRSHFSESSYGHACRNHAKEIELPKLLKVAFEL